jgi:hypothetical protein
MGPKPINNDSPETIKAKRGRKSKKELMASLNIKTTEPSVPISLHVSEKSEKESINTNNFFTDMFTNVLNSEDLESDVLNSNDNKANTEMVECETKESIENNVVIISGPPNEEQKPTIKKRGRKPKGGKIIQQITSLTEQKEDKPNVILHLKCSMKDLLTNNVNSLVESYNLNKNDLSYDIIGNENINNVNLYYNDKTIPSNDNEYDDEDLYCKDSSKEIWKKLKQLEHNLHINNVVNKRSACFWDTCEFDNPPIYIPKYFINGTYNVYGCFCSPECAVAYLMNENIDSSIKFERYHLLNHIYTKIYDYKKNIKPAPNPYYMLEKFYGNLSIQEYRSLLRNERLFLIVDKPLTRILPELHEDNDDFILNNKIIPSNNYNLKTRLQRKKQNKSSILNEKFGISNQAILE